MTLATDPRRRFGDRGEELAADFFRARGFQIVERNWNCRLGEIDLIVEKQGRVHFVEVKIRQSLAFGYPEASITGKKLRHLARAIEVYLEKQQPPIVSYQVDALAIVAMPGKEADYHYIEYIL